MKISIKTEQEIKIMHEGGKKLSSILGQLFQMGKPGVNLLDLEKKAIQLIEETGGEPAFARAPGYHWATCLNINEEIVHGIPKEYIIKVGDVVNIDMGLYYKGFNTDMSSTILVKNSPKDTSEVAQEPRSGAQTTPARWKEINRFLKTGKKALKEAINQAKPGNYIGHISSKIQEIVEGAGYSCARNLTGHGIGRKLHELPSIPCFLQSRIKDTPLLKSGMTIAIEVIYCMGKSKLVINPKDKWTIKTKDGKISAVFEETIAIDKKGALVLTKLPF